MNSPLTPLLKKYNVAGPRYTSYPTVPAWHEGVGPHDYRQSLRGLGTGEALSLYFHLPFCERLCHFCGCMQVITTDHSRSRPYVDDLFRELDLVVEDLPKTSRRVSQLHFGGGTPNFLQPEELAQILTRLRTEFDFASDAELAIEMHPRTSTQAFCEMLRELGFNRISLGIQDFDPQVQQLIHRNQTYEQTAAMVEALRRLGFQSFNFDLIYGLPGQTLGGWEKTLNRVRELDPNRLAIYSYAHVPWVRPVQRSFKDEDLPSPELKLELFERAHRFFTEQGYQAIGMDHFATAADELAHAARDGTLHRNFMGYSTRADAHQLGFGVSAISFVGGNYFQNQKTLPAYEQTVRSGERATFRGFILGRDDLLRRELIAEIMCLGKLDIAAFEKKWGLAFADYFSREIQDLDPFLADGLLRLTREDFQVQGLGQLFLRNISMVFDVYLQDIRKNATNPTFSKTV